MIEKIKKQGKVNGLLLIWAEIKKNIKILFRGPSKTIFILCLIFPLTYLLFMNLVFGAVNFNYAIAVVIPDYDSNEKLKTALNDNKLPNTQEFLNYLNNNSVVGPTIVKSHVEFIGVSEQEFEEKLKNQEISLIVILPVNFESAIESVKNGTRTQGKLNITLRILNINEDYVKNIYFGFRRKLKAYYENVLSQEIEVKYLYENANPDRLTFPRMWTIGTGALVFLCLVSSMIISATFIFNEKNYKMRQELSIALSKNQEYTYIGKISSSIILSFTINFPLGGLIIFLALGLPFPINFPGFILITFATITVGAFLGAMIDAIIPEQVFTLPISVFLVLSTLFMCGGFIDIEIFDPIMKSIVQWIPFTYFYEITKITILTGESVELLYIIGIIAYSALFYMIGWLIFKKFVISSK
ncbi:MAG: ABC transporter permease [Promethearchaeota archaeon]